MQSSWLNRLTASPAFETWSAFRDTGSGGDCWARNVSNASGPLALMRICHPGFGARVAGHILSPQSTVTRPRQRPVLPENTRVTWGTGSRIIREMSLIDETLWWLPWLGSCKFMNLLMSGRCLPTFPNVNYCSFIKGISYFIRICDVTISDFLPKRRENR